MARASPSWPTAPTRWLRPLALAALLVAGTVTAVIAPTAVAAMATHALAALIVFAAATMLLHRARPEPLRRGATRRFEQRAWLGAVVPLAAITGLQSINTNIDLLSLGVLRSDDEVGVYKVATAIANLMAFGLTVTVLVTQPHIARLHAKGDTAGLQRLASFASAGTLAFALAAALAFVTAGPPLVALLYGDTYVAASAPLAVLAGGKVVTAAFGPVGAFLTMTGHQNRNLPALITAIGVNIILNMLLVPPFGMTGAATATAASVVCLHALYWRQVRRALGVHSTAWPLLRQLIRPHA